MEVKNEKNPRSKNIPQMLKYAAVALSAVSFITTLNGVKGIVTDDIWLAGLISFGIQAIILVMGLWFLPALIVIWKKKMNVMLRSFLCF